MEAPSMIPQHGSDPSCGLYRVSVAAQKQFHPYDSASIIVLYDECIDFESITHHDVLRGYGPQISVEDIENLLNSARVPGFIKSDCAIDMILQFVDGTLMDIKDQPACNWLDEPTLLPSILVKITSDKETFDWNEFVSEYMCCSDSSDD